MARSGRAWTGAVRTVGTVISKGLANKAIGKLPIGYGSATTRDLCLVLLEIATRPLELVSTRFVVNALCTGDGFGFEGFPFEVLSSSCKALDRSNYSFRAIFFIFKLRPKIDHRIIMFLALPNFFGCCRHSLGVAKHAVVEAILGVFEDTCFETVLDFAGHGCFDILGTASNCQKTVRSD
jgi:hypothetical protein